MRDTPARDPEDPHDDGAKWRALARHWPGYIITIDAENRVTWMNRSTRVMDATAALGRSMLDFLVLEERAPFEASVDQVRATGAASMLRTSARLPDGTRHNYLTQLIPTDDAGSVAMLTMETTADVQAEALLASSDRRHRALVEASRDAISLTAADGTTLYMSPGVERMTGFAPSELVGKNAVELVHPDDREYVAGVRRRLLDYPTAVATVEVRTRHRDGSIRWMEATCRNLLGDPAVGAIVGNFRDITERRALGERLAESQKMEAVGVLASGVAHEFNNLLHIILSYSELVTTEVGPHAPCAGDLREISSAADRAASLTRQLLAFCRKEPRETRHLSVGAVVAGMERLLRPLVGARVSVSTSFGDPVGAVEADPRQIEQIVMNLAVNARDAMRSEGVLAIRTREEALDGAAARELGVAPGPYVLLAVSDTGCGMTPELQARIFEPFFTTKSVGEGTGLGLSTVFGIVKQSGGAVAVDSAPGRGSCFRVYFPCVDRTAQARPSRTSPDVARRGAESLLVVEDDDDVRRVMVRVLARAGYKVREANLAVAALKAWGESGSAIDLVVTDVVMPGLDGPSLARRLRATRPEVPILFVSGCTEHGAVKGPTITSRDHFLAKPFMPEALLAAVRTAIDGEAGGDRLRGGRRPSSAAAPSVAAARSANEPLDRSTSGVHTVSH